MKSIIKELANVLAAHFVAHATALKGIVREYVQSIVRELRIRTYMGALGLQTAMANLYSQRVYDNALLMRAASLIAATATEATVIDLGGTGLLDADLVLDVSAIEVATGDESYRVMLQGSPDAAFTAGTIAVLADICLGASGSAAKTLGLQGFSDDVGRHIVPFRNEKNGTTYRYLRLRTVVVGTIATGMNFSAWIAKDD